MTPLLLTGLGVAVAFRARLWNIGGEGQFLVGALAASARRRLSPARACRRPCLIPLLLLAGALAGALWAGLAGWMRVGARRPGSHQHDHAELRRRATALVSGRLRRADAGSTAMRSPPRKPCRPTRPCPAILPNTPVHLGLAIALLAAVVVAVYLFAHARRLRHPRRRREPRRRARRGHRRGADADDGHALERRAVRAGRGGGIVRRRSGRSRRTTRPATASRPSPSRCWGG